MGDLAHTPPAGWTCCGGGNAGFFHAAPFTNVYDANDATYGAMSIADGQGCSAYAGEIRQCGANFGWSSGTAAFTVYSFRLKGEWFSNPQTGSVVQILVVCEPGWFNTIVYDSVTGFPSSFDTGQVNLATPCTIDPLTSKALQVLVRIDRNNAGGESRWYSAEFFGTLVRDYGSDKPLGFRRYSKYSRDPVNLATGNFFHQATDLSMPGRLLGLSFTRFYNSADESTGPLGPGWTHSYNWRITDGGATVDVRRGDGAVDRFTQNPDLSYSAPNGVFDTLIRNGDSTYTFTLKDQQALTFSSAGALTRISEPAGNHIDLTYTSGRLTSITDAVGRAVTVGYDGSNRLSQVQDPIGRKVTYGYDGSDRLITVTDKIGNAAGQTPADHQWHYAYDGSSRHITTITDPDGRVVVTNSYDPQGRVFEQLDGLMKLTTFAYSPGQTVETDPRGNATTYLFDGLFRQLSESIVVSGTTRTLSYTYDAAGNRDSVTDRNQKTTNFVFDARGNLFTQTDPQVEPTTPRYVTTFLHDSRNNLYQITDARGFVTTIAFDPVTNVQLSTTRQITAGPATFATTKWEYGDAANPGLPTKIIDPHGNTTGTPNYTYSKSLTYNAWGELIQQIDADGSKTTFGYDGVGRPTSMVDPEGYAPGGVPAEHTWTTIYDENDRVTQTTDPLGHSTFTAYDGTGNRTSSTDANSNVVAFVYDDAGRLGEVQQKPDPVGQPLLVYTTSVVRDDNGNATQVTEGNGVVTNSTYDELDRLTSVTTHPSGTLSLTTSYELDGNGNPEVRTLGDGTVVTYTYDAMSRPTEVSAIGLDTIRYEYDELSRRVLMEDGTGTSTYTYDGLGRITSAVQPSGTLGYGYELDFPTTISYPTLGSVTYGFSPAGRLSTVTDWASRVSTYTYTAAGQPKSVAVPGGMTTRYTYDKALRLTGVQNATSTATVSSHLYTLDNQGNRIATDELIGGLNTSVKVNSDAGTVVQDHPDIAVGADAAGYLIWDDARTGNADIEFAKRDPVTGTWGTNVKVNTDTTTRLQQNPAIDLDSADNAFAVWQDERNGVGKPDIYYSKRSVGPGTWSTPNLKVNDDAGGGGGALQRNPRIAGTAVGAETAVWVDLRSNQNNVYSSTLASGGSSWAANKKVTDNTAALKDFPDVAVGANGTSYAVWQDSRNGNPDIYFSTLAAGAGAWTANVKISDDPGTTGQTRPRIGVDTLGNLLVVWIDARTSPAQVRAVRKLVGGSWSSSVVVSPSPSGNSWSAPQRLDDDPGTTAAQLAPTVAYTAAETILSWRDNRLSTNGDTQARRFDHFGMTYDGLNRLKGVTGTVAETFVLDGAANITLRSGTVETYDTADRLTADGATVFTWSNADRLSLRGADSFTYDPLDRLKDSTVAGTSRVYTYDADGLMRSRTQGSTMNFLWDPSSSPSRLIKHGADSIIYGLGPLYVVKSDTTTLTFARDGGKSVRAQVTSAGAVSAAFRYRAYGHPDDVRSDLARLPGLCRAVGRPIRSAVHACTLV